MRQSLYRAVDWSRLRNRANDEDCWTGHARGVNPVDRDFGVCDRHPIEDLGIAFVLDEKGVHLFSRVCSQERDRPSLKNIVTRAELKMRDKLFGGIVEKIQQSLVGGTHSPED